jgi:UDP-N-acetylmuramate dehydrogenase
MSIWGNLPVSENVSLAGFTTWKVGGPARWYAEPKADEVSLYLAKAAELEIPVFYLGRGSNILIPDKGVDGLVLHGWKSLCRIARISNELVEAETGVPLPRLSRFVADIGCGGFEFLIGIPGTVGGGVAMNAGLRVPMVREISDVLDSMDVVEKGTGEVQCINSQDADLRYRYSRFLEEGQFILRARFRLEDFTRGREAIRRLTAHHLEERRIKQPLSRQTAGSTFKQLAGGPATGWYIDKAGLKGTRIGGAIVSQKHANWIETEKGAQASDVLKLMDKVVDVVQSRFGVTLESEVQIFGQR